MKTKLHLAWMGVCLFLFIIFSIATADIELVSKSHVIASAIGWFPQTIHGYEWLSGSRLRYFREENANYVPCNLDTISGHISENRKLEKLLSLYDNDIWGASFSPNSEKLLLNSKGEKSIYDVLSCKLEFTWKDQFSAYWLNENSLVILRSGELPNMIIGLPFRMLSVNKAMPISGLCLGP